MRARQVLYLLNHAASLGYFFMIKQAHLHGFLLLAAKSQSTLFYFFSSRVKTFREPQGEKTEAIQKKIMWKYKRTLLL
jgi:Ni,Fe-hydrogenase I cytochrome b subunit